MNDPSKTLIITDRYNELRVSHHSLARFLGRDLSYVNTAVREVGKGHTVYETSEKTSQDARGRGRPTIHRWLTEEDARRVLTAVSGSLTPAQVGNLLLDLKGAFDAHRPAEEPREVLKARLQLQLDTIIRLNRKIGELNLEIETLKRGVAAARTMVMGEAHKHTPTLGAKTTGRYARPGFFSYRLWSGYVPSRHYHGLKMLEELGVVNKQGNPTELGAPYAKLQMSEWSFDQALLELCRDVVKETAEAQRRTA